MTLDWLHVIIAILGFVLSGVAAVWRVSWVVSQMVSRIDKQIETTKAEFHALLTLKEAEFGDKIGRMYGRFDEYKEKIEDKFVSKESCQLLHATTANQLIEMKANHSQQIKELKEAIMALTEKIDTLLMRKQ